MTISQKVGVSNRKACQKKVLSEHLQLFLLPNGGIPKFYQAFKVSSTIYLILQLSKQLQLSLQQKVSVCEILKSM